MQPLPGGILNLSEEALIDLAMNNDPIPVLQGLSQMQGGGNFLTMPQPGTEAGPGDSYESIIAGTQMQQPTKPQQKQAAPLGNEALRLLAAMNPQQQPRAPAATLPRPQQVQFQAVTQPAKPQMSLAQILGR